MTIRATIRTARAAAMPLAATAGPDLDGSDLDGADAGGADVDDPPMRCASLAGPRGGVRAPFQMQIVPHTKERR